MNKSIIISILISMLIIGGTFVLMRGRGVSPSYADGANVVIEDGVQIVNIDARGGYRPKVSIAKAGVATIVRFNTRATFDCSASVTIPELRLSKLLPSNGSTDIDIGTREVGPLLGSCGMGMYPFSIEFE